MGMSACKECRKKNVETKAPSTSSPIQPSWIQEKGSSGSCGGGNGSKSPLSKMSSNVLQSYRKRAANVQRKKSQGPGVRREGNSRILDLGARTSLPKKDKFKEVKKRLENLNILHKQGGIRDMGEHDNTLKYKKGEQEKGSTNIGLCDYTTIWAELKDGYKPSIINGIICTGDRECLNGYGFCEEREKSLTVFDPNGKAVEVKMPVACEPKILQGSALHKFVSGKKGSKS